MPHPDLPALEQLLTTTWGGPVQLAPGEALQERTHVWRFPVAVAPAGAPASVIVKQPRLRPGEVFNPEAADPTSGSASLFDDWAGLQFLGTVMGAASPAPHWWAGDRAAGYFVMEDLGAGQNPADLLTGNDAAAAEAFLLNFAAAQGQLHAATTGHAATFAQQRQALGPRDLRVFSQRYQQLPQALQAAGALLDVPIAAAAMAQVERVTAALLDPGPFAAYTHGDPCPDNWSLMGGQLRLFDFEGGQFRHALRDGVYGWMHFPTCWCVGRMPAGLPQRMEQAYRAALIPGCPAAADDTQFAQATVEMCAGWVLAILGNFYQPFSDLLQADRIWGLATQRQRLWLRANLVAELTQTAGYLEALGTTLAQIASAARQHWPEPFEEMPVYPAFVGG